MLKQKVLVEDLQPGMFVYELDRPWLDTPYLIQGFLIESPEQIEELRRHCSFVYIDPGRSTYDVASQLKPGLPHPVAEQEEPPLSIPGRTVYQDKTTVEDELPVARPIRETFIDLLTSVQDEIRHGAVLEIGRLKGALTDMMDSVIRNPNALMLLTTLKEKDPSSLGYSLNVAICLLAFGRHLGFPRDQLEYLGLGGLLLDIGKLRLPEALLKKKTPLTGDEHKLMKSHVDLGVQILATTPGIPAEVLAMVAAHHEREDGTGYPQGIAGNEISLHGRMAAIVDCFEDLTRERSYAPPVSPQTALRMLQQWRGRFFEARLVDEFIRCLGLYPAGSLVELNTGEVAVILANNPRDRLRPRVMLILDPKKKAYWTREVVDLSAPEAGSEPREISRGLEPGTHGINPSTYFQQDPS